jgi:hypothetical protein
VTLPLPFEVVAVVLLVGGNGVWLAWATFWPHSPRTFWLTAGGIVLGVIGLLVTGAAGAIGRRLFPRDSSVEALCEVSGIYASILIVTVVLLTLLVLWPKVVRGFQRNPTAVVVAGAVLTACLALLFASPLPERLGSLVYFKGLIRCG